jgi:two-component system cell cycle response regulator DivK
LPKESAAASAVMFTPPRQNGAGEHPPNGRLPGAAAQRGAAGSRSAGLVLIADDTFDTRELYGLYLTLCGFAVQTVTDGEAAVQIAVESRPDVIVLDCSMPGVDGITATKRIKEHPRTCHIPVIVVTAFPHQAAQRGALEAGADVFLEKPCLPEDLGQHVQQLIDRRRGP